MDDSFRVRVDKVFGSLTPSTSSLRSLWSLTDEEVEKKEWNRERGTIDRENNPCSSSFDGFFSKQRKISEKNSRMLQKKLDDDDGYELDEDEGERQGPGISRQSLDQDEEDDDKVEEWEIRSFIGLDSTLDNEEEEDEHDKVALGKERDAGERLYMKDITDYGPYLNSHNIIPESFDDEHARKRDSRSNVYAAKIRLKEDKEAFGFDNKVTVPVIEDGGSRSLKSVLKRKENKSQKRVRFDPAALIDDDKPKEEEDAVMLNSNNSNTGRGGVPDYIQNPSRYTRYSFDSGNETDENTNQQAFMDFLNTIKKADSELEAAHDLIPNTVTFIPKKKGSAVMKEENMSSKKPSQAPGITTATAREDEEACAMEEDDPVEAKSRLSQKGGRRYRSKLHPDDD